MKVINFDQIDETLYYKKLENGLDVYILPKMGFNKTYATFTTKYGSIDNRFSLDASKEPYSVPDGIAHFLEHKMFEKEDGDVFQQFSKQGASANAFTSFTRTAYLFSSTSNTEQNLETLMNMVQEPYFTEATVEKEKGIIGQEITMYDDNPDWRLYFGTIENMYHHHPVKIDIAGTIDSITDITAELLYDCYNTFYHPSNMLLFIIGPENPEDMIALIESIESKKQFDPPQTIHRFYETEPNTVAKKKQILNMNVQTPKCLVGIKGTIDHEKGESLLKKELTSQILLEMLFGKSSSVYEQLYESGLIDDTFQYEFTQEQEFAFAIVGGDTEDADKLAEKLNGILLEAKQGKHLTEKALDKAKKKRIGSFLRSINSPEYIANQFTRYAFNEMNFFQVVPLLEEIKFEDVIQRADELIDHERMTVCQVMPKKQ